MLLKKHIFKVYDGFMMILALIIAVIAIVQLTTVISTTTASILYKIDKSIYIIFVIDYVVRLIISKDKWKFIKNNKIDLLVIIPFEFFLKVFSGIKIIKATKVFKLAIVVKGTLFLNESLKKIHRLIRTNTIVFVLLVTLVLIFTSAALIAIIEELTFGDALWWSFVTATSVGYGDISPTTTEGRIVAILLMMTGVGFMGMLSGAVASYFLKQENRKNKAYNKSEILTDIKKKLDTFEELSVEDLEEIHRVLKELKNQI